MLRDVQARQIDRAKVGRPVAHVLCQKQRHRVELRRSTHERGFVTLGRSSGQGGACERRRPLTQRRPPRSETLVDARGCDLRVESPPALETQCRSIGEHDPVTGGRGPGRPPVHDDGSQPGLCRDLPERFLAAVAAAGNRWSREAEEVRGSTDQPSERRSFISLQGTLQASDSPGFERSDAMDRRRLAGCDRRPQPCGVEAAGFSRVVQGESGAATEGLRRAREACPLTQVCRRRSDRIHRSRPAGCADRWGRPRAAAAQVPRRRCRG